MAEKRTTYKIQDLGGIGEVHIADEVVAIVAGLAATDVVEFPEKFGFWTAFSYGFDIIPLT